MVSVTSPAIISTSVFDAGLTCCQQYHSAGVVKCV